MEQDWFVMKSVPVLPKSNFHNLREELSCWEGGNTRERNKEKQGTPGGGG